MKKLKKMIALPIFILAFVLFSCEKNSNDPNPPDPPPGKIFKSEITVTFIVPTNVRLSINDFVICDGAGTGITPNLRDYVVLPTFTYKVDTKLAREYLGKKVILYLGGSRSVNNQSYGTDNLITIEKLLDKNNVVVNIEDPI